MFDIKIFGAFLSRLRKAKDMTQSQLADLLNVTRQAVSKYENGDSFPDISILLIIASIFEISLDSLINAGNPTEVEKTFLTHVALNKTNEIADDVFDKPISKEFINIAPLLKASTLEVIAKRFKKHDIDISNIIALAEYVNDETLMTLLEKASYDTIDPVLLSNFIPFLDNESKMIIFHKILDGELNPQLLKILIPYTDKIRELIENAVVCGVLDHEVLQLLRN